MPKTNAVSCSHTAHDNEVYERLQAATSDLSASWDKLKKASVIAIKFNQDLAESRMFQGNRQELVSDSVARASLRLLRERTSAELICVDASYFKIYGDKDPTETTQIAHVLEEYGVRYVDCTTTPLQDCPVPGGDGLFSTYRLAKELVHADEVVSIAKMKNHKFMGITGSLKNLFGLMAAEPYARPRHYYHHLVRMPYMLCDIGRILNPALNIVDGLVGQAGKEWSKEDSDGRVTDMLIAGDNTIATDACMTHLMGLDPQSDWLTDPFLRDRNSLLVSKEHGFGTNRIDEIDFSCGIDPQPQGTFYCDATDDRQIIIDWRRSMCKQALYYRDNMAKFHNYADEYILMQSGEVVWHSSTGTMDTSRRKLAGSKTSESLYLKFVDPDEQEQERYEVYEQALNHIKELGL